MEIKRDVYIQRLIDRKHNGMIRRFIPKGCAIAGYSKPDVRKVQDWLNNYPRKILKGKTPAMLLEQGVPRPDSDTEVLQHHTNRNIRSMLSIKG